MTACQRCGRSAARTSACMLTVPYFPQIHPRPFNVTGRKPVRRDTEGARLVSSIGLGAILLVVALVTGYGGHKLASSPSLASELVRFCVLLQLLVHDERSVPHMSGVCQHASYSATSQHPAHRSHGLSPHPVLRCDHDLPCSRRISRRTAACTPRWRVTRQLVAIRPGLLDLLAPLLRGEK